jgi:hypothetical protein
MSTLLKELNLSLPIPSYIFEYPEELQLHVFNYLSQLNKDELKAYIIAKNHLGTSFNIIRSSGYNDWFKTQNIIK